MMGRTVSVSITEALHTLLHTKSAKYKKNLRLISSLVISCLWAIVCHLFIQDLHMHGHVIIEYF